MHRGIKTYGAERLEGALVAHGDLAGLHHKRQARVDGVGVLLALLGGHCNGCRRSVWIVVGKCRGCREKERREEKTFLMFELTTKFLSHIASADAKKGMHGKKIVGWKRWGRCFSET